MDLLKGHTYLCRERNLSHHHPPLILFFSSMRSKNVCKMKNLTTQEFLFVHKDKFDNNSVFGADGYFVESDLSRDGVIPVPEIKNEVPVIKEEIVSPPPIPKLSFGDFALIVSIRMDEYRVAKVVESDEVNTKKALDIKHFTCLYFKVDPNDKEFYTRRFTGTYKKNPDSPNTPAYMPCKQVGMYLMRTMTNLSLAQIGKYYAGMDHTSIIHSKKQIQKKLDIGDSATVNAINFIKNKLEE